jgi:hypothetical protein
MRIIRPRLRREELDDPLSLLGVCIEPRPCLGLTTDGTTGFHLLARTPAGGGCLVVRALDATLIHLLIGCKHSDKAIM